MDCITDCISYQQTGYFSKIVADYLCADEKLTPFYRHPVSVEGVRSAIAARQKFNTNRVALVDILKEQYADISLTEKQQQHIDALLQPSTFTITTAHQPNIFTGPLYFIYKILHAIKLSATLQSQLPEYKFVPVYYMGSEDADLDELNHVHLNGTKHIWQTTQTGAVGRMKADKQLLKMIDEIAGEVLIHPHGKEIIEKIKTAYAEGTAIAEATCSFVNDLFADHGLLILLPDTAKVKTLFADVMEKEISEQFSHKAVAATVAAFPSEYKVQAAGRDINLFYLIDDKRERIIWDNGKFKIQNLQLEFTLDELLQEFKTHPERCSPNVILRPVLQETILPNVAFIGGGGELAYWLELEKVFVAAQVPYPVLVLRNSFVVLTDVAQELKTKLQLSHADMFKPSDVLLNELVKKHSTLQLQLDEEKRAIETTYNTIATVSGKVDTTLAAHAQALKHGAIKRIEALEKKLLRAERKKYEAEQRQIQKFKSLAFPNNNLQERTDSVILFYALYGKAFINTIYQSSPSLEQRFTIVSLK